MSSLQSQKGDDDKLKMSFHRNNIGTRSVSVDRNQQSRYNAYDSDIDSPSRKDSLPELSKFVRKLLAQEVPSNIHVRNVEYIENRCQRLTGTLYMTTFRLVFAPDNEITKNNLISSGNKYIGEYDIPLTSIYKINVAPVDSRLGFKSFLNENQIQSETRTFTIITRDFRNITFTKCSVTQSNSLSNKPQVSVTKMETFITSLRAHCRFQDKEQLYPYLALQKNPMNNLSSRSQRVYSISSSNGRSIDDEIADLSISNDERIKNYMTYQDWNDELYDANEKQWVIDHNKFDRQYIVKNKGPFVRLASVNDNDGLEDLIWHWTHTSDVEHDRRYQQNRKPMQFMLVTVPGIGESTVTGDPIESSMSSATVSLPSYCFLNIPKKLRSHVTDGPPVICTNDYKTAIGGLMMASPVLPGVGLRRATTDSSLTYSNHYVSEQAFQRYNLAKFPCNLKRLQTSYEKLIELCVITPEDDDDKWFTKLNTCKWLKYVSKALHGAASLAKLLNYKNIELAGSDIDNSCLMSSLIQILLRPKCRTIKGFCELIVREWIIHGHPFRERFGQVLCDIDGYPAQESPVFLLFLDCVHQLILQNSFSFEFTDYFLLELYHNVCYCYHHTFAFNSVLERLNAIINCPKNLFILSSFDFSLYLSPDTCRLLKNDASIFTLKKSSPQQSKHSSSQRPNRTIYYLESPKLSNIPPVTNENTSLDAEQFEYDTIESPQKFSSDLHVDWRIFNMTLWSKCYCRYDQNYLPTLREQQLAFEISCLQEDIKNTRTKTRRQMTVDTLHSFTHANSWHPQMLDTRV